MGLRGFPHEVMIYKQMGVHLMRGDGGLVRGKVIGLQWGSVRSGCSWVLSKAAGRCSWMNRGLGRGLRRILESTGPVGAVRVGFVGGFHGVRLKRVGHRVPVWRMSEGSSSRPLVSSSKLLGSNDEEADRVEKGYGTVDMSGPRIAPEDLGTGKVLRNRRYVKVNFKETVGLGVVTAVTSGVLGSALHSFPWGAIAAGATVISWLSTRLFLTRIDHREIERALGHWDGAVKTMTNIIEALQSKVDIFTMRHNILVYLALIRIVDKKKLAERGDDIEGTVPVQLSKQEMTDILRICKYSSAAYGPLLLLLGMLQGGFSMSSKYIIKGHTNLKNADFVSVELDGESMLYPRHYVAFDHVGKNVVLSVRGTLALSDVATDLMCAATPFLGGTAHDGMKASAQLLWSKRKETVLKALARYPDYSLVITGHSMGAGTAMLLTLKLLMEPRSDTGLPDDLSVKCYAFACPPVFDPLSKVPDEVNNAIYAIQVKEDVVPSLSLASVTALLQAFHRIDELNYDLPAHLRAIADQNNRTDIAEVVDPSIEDDDNFHHLSIPGRRIWFPSARSARQVVDRESSGRLLVTDNMVSDHFVNVYESVLEGYQASHHLN